MKWILPSTWIDSSGRALLFSLLTLCGSTHAQSSGYLEVGMFSSARAGESLPHDWQPLSFRRIERHTGYSMVEEGGTVVIRAVSDQSASGLMRVISIDPTVYPVIQWRWKVNNILRNGDVSSKAGDDYPARIYITFAFDPDRAGYLERLEHEAARLIRGKDVPYRAISYIWGSKVKVSLPQGVIEGEAVDLDHDGALLIRTSSGVVEKVIAGDIVRMRQK